MGFAALGVAAIALFWFLVSAIYLDEAGVDLTPTHTATDYTEFSEISHTIFVKASNQILIDGAVYELDELQNKMKSDRSTDKNQRVILRIHEDVRHAILVEIKDALDELNYDVLLEIIKTSEAGSQ